MPGKSLGRFVRIAILLLVGLGLGPVALAQQAKPAAKAAAISGRTAMSVTLGLDGSLIGEINKAEDTRWVQTDTSDEVVYTYQETKRDDSSVYLTDRVRGITLQLDLRAGRAIQRETASRRTQYYEIRSAATVASVINQSGELRGPQFRSRQNPGTLADDAPAVRAEPPAFCVSDTVARGAGKLPGRAADCPAGFTADGGMCKRAGASIAAPSRAADCPAGFSSNGGSCERAATTKANTNSRLADCPEGFTNSGDACFRLSAPNPLPLSAMTCKPGEIKNDARCYRSCEAGFNASGTSCVRPASTVGADKMTCKAGFQKSADGLRCIADCASGYTNSGDTCVRAAQTAGPEAMTCKTGETKSGGRCVASASPCAKGELLQAGMCYSPCAPGFDGIGSVCVRQAPATWQACGVGAAKNAQACTAAAFDKIGGLRQAAVLTNAASGAQRAVKFKEMTDAYAQVKDAPEFRKARETWEQANANALPLDKMAVGASDDEIQRYAVQLVAIGELTGPVVGRAPTTYPKCSTLFPGK